MSLTVLIKSTTVLIKSMVEGTLVWRTCTQHRGLQQGMHCYMTPHQGCTRHSVVLSAYPAEYSRRQSCPKAQVWASSPGDQQLLFHMSAMVPRLSSQHIDVETSRKQPTPKAGGLTLIAGGSNARTLLLLVC